MKRYTIEKTQVSNNHGIIGINARVVERDDGYLCKFTDHQAEIAKFEQLLMECSNLWFAGLENVQPDEEELYERVKKLIA